MTHITDRIDAYVDGELDSYELAAVEAHLQICAACRADVDGTRTLVTRLRELPRAVAPRSDAWPRIEQQLARPRRAVWPFVAAAGGLAVAAMAMLAVLTTAAVWFGQGGGPADVSGAQALLDGGDLVGAEAAYDVLLAAHPTDRAALEGASYCAMLRGDYAGADKMLAIVGDDPDTLLRRALVAEREGDLDDVQAFGERSKLPLGQFLAAEVYLADADPGGARDLLRPLARGKDDLGIAAREYLTLIDAADPSERGLAEITALWALGEREAAVESAAELVPAIADGDHRNVAALIWAGRAVTSGDPDGAEALLDAIDAPPPDQAWRVVATRAMVHAARGQGDDAIALFTMLDQGGAPASGLAFARATAAGLSPDPRVAEAIVGTDRGAAVSRALREANSPTWAATAPESGAYGRFARGQ